VAAIAVGLERGLERRAGERAFDRSGMAGKNFSAPEAADD
jgi:hypothetical protein